jgi:hypothetical protein
MPDTNSPVGPQDLPALAQQVREAHSAVQKAGGALLHHAMVAGDALIAAQQKVSSNWKRWLRENCFLSVDTALVYQRLARHREQIEAEIGRAGDLSLRAALRLIATPKGGKTKKTTETSLVEHWKRTSDQDRTAFLDHIGVDGVRMAASLDFYRELVVKLRAEKTKTNPDAMLTSLLAKALSHVAIAEGSATSGPVADSNNAEALASLRAVLKKLGAIGRSYHDVSIGITATKARARRRAA